MCVVSVNLMTYVIISKYADGMPLYRLENIIKRYGGEISRATLANWVIALSKQAQPLINLLRESSMLFSKHCPMLIR
jgi:transposase